MRRAERRRSLVLLRLLTLGCFLCTSAQVSVQPEAEVVEKRTTIGPSLTAELPASAEKLCYPIPERGFHIPANVEADLKNAFPRRGSVLPSIPPPRPYFEFKVGLYERIGLKLAFSYQMIALGASSAKPAGEDLSQGKQTAWAGGLLIEAQWVFYRGAQCARHRGRRGEYATVDAWTSCSTS